MRHRPPARLRGQAAAWASDEASNPGTSLLDEEPVDERLDVRAPSVVSLA